MKRVVALAAFLVAAAGHAATFLVPSDHDLIEGADAIAVVTAGESHSRRADGGWIETVTALHIDEAIKGEIEAGTTIDVAELGGVVGNVGYAVAGSPQFSRGERSLVFLERDERGNWTTRAMAVGKFAFAKDTAGRPLLVRDSSEIAGWNYDGRVHREPQRHGPEFLQYVRDVAAGENERTADYVVIDPQPLSAPKAKANATPSINSYLLQNSDGIGIRWSSFPSPVVFLSHGSQPGALNGGLISAQRGLNLWTNDPGSNVVYQYGGTTNVSSTGLNSGGADGVNIILFNDPSNEIPGSFRGQGGDVLAVGGALYTLQRHSFNGEQFYTIVEGDLVVQDGITGAGLTGNGFDHVLAHELGHTLGFRHSDEPPAGGTSTTNALMNSSVNFNADGIGASLLPWDQEALAAVYGNGSSGGGGGNGGGGVGGGGGGNPGPGCAAPGITAQPQSQSLSAAGSVTLSVSATGTEPEQFQWYGGSKGNTGSPVNNAITSSLTISVSNTTSYWVRITNACGSIDSDAAVITVSGCPAVIINAITDNTEIVEGRSIDLNVSATGGTNLAYQWFTGPVGTTSSPLSTATKLTVTPLVTTTYWVQVSNSCAAVAKSDAIVVTVVPCTQPRVVVQPSNQNVVGGTTAILYAGVTGSAPVRFEWFEGALNDTSKPVGDNTSTLTTKPVTTATSYWVRISNPCGQTASAVATITPVATCTAPSIAQQPLNSSAFSGSNAMLSVVANVVNPTYRWYQGDVLNFSNPVGANSPVLFTPAITATTKFWVRVDSPCGTINSTAATVTVASAPRRRSTRP